MRELELIARIGARVGAAGPGVRVGIGDDCAVLGVSRGCEMVVTTDFSLEGRHFRRDWHTAESAGHRSLARGLSDVAGMGGRPVAAFLSLGLPAGFDLVWVDDFMAGFLRLAERFGVTLAGGDTGQVNGEEMVADVVVTGEVRRGRALLRSGAKVGDGIFVTGELGGSAVELARLAAGERGSRGVHCFPEPQVKAGQRLVGLATSCMDLSDGLSTDLGHLCRASGVGAEVDRVPLAAGATLAQGLHGGEDYGLLFTTGGKVPGRIAGVEVTRIGTVVQAPGVRLQGQELSAGGWEHFA